MKLPSLKDGLKRARKEHIFYNKDGKREKFTQKALADTIHVSLDTVRNWEQGKATPSLSMLLDLADLYQCDLDYLTGKIDCKTHEKQFICDETGLSETAVDILQYWHDNNPQWINHVSAILTEPEIIEVFRWMSHLVDAPTVNRKINNNQICSDFYDSDNVKFELSGTLHQISRHFENLSEKIFDRAKDTAMIPENTDGDPYYGLK